MNADVPTHPRPGRTNVLVPVLMLAACSIPPAQSWGLEPEPGLLFQTGFSGTILSVRNRVADDLGGADPGLAPPHDWAVVKQGCPIGDAFIHYEDGDRSQRLAEIVPDPQDPKNPVLAFEILAPHIREGSRRKGRVSLILEKLDQLAGIRETVRLRLDPGMRSLEQWEKPVDWLTLFEFWSGDSRRITISLCKPKGAGNALHWRAACETFHLFGGWNREWSEIATGYACPYDTWMNLELQIRVGAEGKARCWASVTDAHTPRTTLWDTRRAFGDSWLSKINPLKLYTSDTLISHLRSQDKRLRVWWDDLRLYRFPIDAPAP